jgi:hypothetical protein
MMRSFKDLAQRAARNITDDCIQNAREVTLSQVIKGRRAWSILRRFRGGLQDAA